MKLAAQSDFFVKNYGPADGLKRVKEIGYNYASYTVTERYDEPFTTEWTEKELKEFFAPVGQSARDNGLELLYTTVSCDVYNELLPHTFEARKKMCVHAVKACAYMGCKIFALPTCNFHRNVAGAYETSKAHTFELFDMVKEEADKHGVKLAVINIPARKSQYCFGCSTEDLLELCDKYGASVVVDPAAAARSGERLERMLAQIGDKLLHAFIISDYEAAFNMPFMPMMGAMNYPLIIDTLKKLGGDTTVVMSYTPVFHRYKHFASSTDLNAALGKLLYDMGRGIIGAENA